MISSLINIDLTRNSRIHNLELKGEKNKVQGLYLRRLEINSSAY